MMKSLRESPPIEWVVSRTTSRPVDFSSGWWPCAWASKAITVASPKAALKVLKVNSRRCLAAPRGATRHDPAARRRLVRVAAACPSGCRCSVHVASASAVIGVAPGSLMTRG